MKEKKKLSPDEQSAKMSVLKDIMGEMDGLMCDDLDSKKKMKVSVLSDSKKGLAEGLDKAEDVVGGSFPKFGGGEGSDDSSMLEGLEDDSEQEDDFSSLTSSEIDEKIKQLMALKDSKRVSTPF